jgi:hypothetical protein
MDEIAATATATATTARERSTFNRDDRNLTMRTRNTEPSQLPADALFRVGDGDEEPVPLEHLERVNPELDPEDKLRLSALRVGKALELSRDGLVVRVRRTR